MGIIRLSALVAVLGILLNRINTALITFNWNLYQEIPHILETIIVVTIFTLYITTYRFILYRLPILYAWKPVPSVAYRAERVGTGVPGALPQPSGRHFTE